MKWCLRFACRNGSKNAVLKGHIGFKLDFKIAQRRHSRHRSADQNLFRMFSQKLSKLGDLHHHACRRFTGSLMSEQVLGH